ncbi:hypothetical protein HPB50_026648 [Hyalomma asiaticum]|uniref:Uncharacterized protein n=1 Tax=Hyalomma asiaticum TaxID=266040 RepID=A0ACB7SZD4_HYAAI|nr:hypothetical protein HPB50_026648 [Hyalomma asiaticum]
MAAPMADGCSSAVSVGSSQKRVNWSVATTEVLIRIWEDKLPALRSNTRNLRIYKEIVQALNASVPAGEGPFNVKQVRQKLENLNKQYRKLRRCGTTTGAKGIEWPFYWQLHAFLGSLPVNDSDLVEESLEVPVVDHAPDEIVATNDTVVATNDSEESESATMEAAVSGTSSAGTPSVEPESSARSSSNKKKGKKRPASVVLHDLLELHQKGEERAAKAASDSLELKKELVALQKESNAIQQSPQPSLAGAESRSDFHQSSTQSLRAFSLLFRCIDFL